jgi:hypothetical protein
MIKRIIHIILLFTIISFISSCSTTRLKINHLKYSLKEKREIRKLKNYTANLSSVRIDVNIDYIDEFEKLDIEEIFENISYDEIREHLLNSYKFTLNYDEFSKSLRNKTYKIEYDKLLGPNDHGELGQFYIYSTELNDTLQNSVEIWIVISPIEEKLFFLKFY